jgi:hypothetical protein
VPRYQQKSQSRKALSWPQAAPPAESQIRQPTVIASGELDPVIPSVWTEHLGETFAEHEPSLLPGIGPSSRSRHRSGAIETIHRALSLGQRERGMGDGGTTT